MRIFTPSPTALAICISPSVVVISICPTCAPDLPASGTWLTKSATLPNFSAYGAFVAETPSKLPQMTLMT